MDKLPENDSSIDIEIECDDNNLETSQHSIRMEI